MNNIKQELIDCIKSSGHNWVNDVTVEQVVFVNNQKLSIKLASLFGGTICIYATAINEYYDYWRFQYEIEINSNCDISLASQIDSNLFIGDLNT